MMQIHQNVIKPWLPNKVAASVTTKRSLHTHWIQNCRPSLGRFLRCFPRFTQALCWDLNSQRLDYVTCTLPLRQLPTKNMFERDAKYCRLLF